VESEAEAPPAILPPVTGPPAELLQALEPRGGDASPTDSEVVDLDDVDDSDIENEVEKAGTEGDSVAVESKIDQKKTVPLEHEAKSAAGDKQKATEDPSLEADDEPRSPLSMAGPSWSGLKTTGNIGALLREGRLPSSGNDSADLDDDDDDSISSLGELDPLVEPQQSDKPSSIFGGLSGPIESPFEIGDEDDDDEAPVGTAVPSGLVSPPWAAGGGIPGLNVEDSSSTADDAVPTGSDAGDKNADAAKAGAAPMSIRDMAAKKSSAVEPKQLSNELEFVEPSAKTRAAKDDAPVEQGFGEALKGLAPLPGISNDLVVGSGTANPIKLSRIQDEARVDTTPIAPLESLQPEPEADDASKSVIAEDVGAPDVSDDKSISSVINPAPAAHATPPVDTPKPVSISPISPPPGLIPAEGQDEADADDPANQAMLNLEPTSKGRFAKSEPTIVDGLDLDVPTLLRGTKDN